jgi:hypothetical protein
VSRWLYVWCICGLLLVLNVLMAGIDIYLGWYVGAAVCAVVVLGLAGTVGHQIVITRRMRHWEEIEGQQFVPPRWPTPAWWTHPQQSLDRCFVCGVCPDCAKESLANFGGGDLMCSEIGCNSRFHRDSKGKWSRK